jgi:iron complex outermembrane receptor protein
LTDHLQLSAGAGYLDGKYKRLLPGVLFSAENELPSTPEWQRNASLTYRRSLGASGAELITRVDYSFNDSYFPAASNASAIPEVTLYNAGVTYVAPSKKWEVSIQGRNLTDEYYWLGGAGPLGAVTGNQGYSNYSMGAPRTLSGRFQYRF